jgi:hypothetical protein
MSQSPVAEEADGHEVVPLEQVVADPEAAVPTLERNVATSTDALHVASASATPPALAECS